jgi:hypothetical protein
MMFSISPAAVQPSAAALARLRSLREVTLIPSDSCDTNPAGLVEQLTCFTQLTLWSRKGSHLEGMFAAAARNPGLQTFSVSGGADTGPTAAQAKHLLTSCPSLACLDLDYMDISQDVLEVILTHGTHITSFRAHTIQSDVSFADRPCSCRSLRIAGTQHYASVLHWAHLPLKGVTELQIWDEAHDGGFTGGLGLLQLPFSSIDLDQLPQKLREATINLAACPAWQAC